ncbi:MAG: metallophosphoesterase, partial [Halobacteriaceae archaeon]
ETRLAVLADPHVATRAEGTAKLFDRTERHLRNAVADIRQRDVDAVLSVGDLTKDGEPWNYDAADAILADLEAPFHAVPGNHDVPKAGDDHEAVPVSGFADRYSPDGAFPFSTTVGGVDVVGINTAGTATFLHDTHDGALDPDREAAVQEALDAADSPVVLTHHNLPATFDQLRAHRGSVEPEMGIPPVTRHGDCFVETLAAYEPALLLTGHLHIPATAHQGGVREIVVPTTCSFPQAYLTLTIDPGGTVVRFHPVASRDGLRYAFSVRSRDSATSRGLTAVASDRLAAFPLVAEGPAVGPGEAPLDDSPSTPTTR